MPPINLLSDLKNIIFLDKIIYNKVDNISIDLYEDFKYNYIYFYYKKNNFYSQNKYFYNSVFLERESKEFFNLNFINILDTRPLLLNYSDFTKILEKKINLQDIKELKTNWLKKKIFFKKSKKIRL